MPERIKQDLRDKIREVKEGTRQGVMGIVKEAKEEAKQEAREVAKEGLQNLLGYVGVSDLPFGFDELNKELEGALEPGEELLPEDWDEMRIEGLPKKPHFPLIIFALAVLKDLADIFSLGMLGTFTNIIAWIAIRMYLLGKVSFIKRYLYRRYIFTLILEYIPWVNAIPQWTIFVLRAYAIERKKIDQILTAIEKLLLREGGGPKFAERFL